ncbi:MAG: hypothetical protein AAF846_17055 [Chloroflexota bacterium]
MEEKFIEQVMRTSNALPTTDNVDVILWGIAFEIAKEIGERYTSDNFSSASESERYADAVGRIYQTLKQYQQ